MGSGWERVVNRVRVRLVAEITSNVLKHGKGTMVENNVLNI